MASNVHIDDIPDEIIITIFSYLPLEDLVNVLQNVSRHWKELCQDPELWRERCLTVEWGSDIDEISFFKKVPQLRKVSFSRDTNAAVFRCLYNTCRNITTLEFGPSQKLSYSTLKTLVDRLPLIECLRISEHMLSNRKLSRAVSSMVNLKMLTVTSCYNFKKPLALRALSEGCPSLQNLDLGYCFCNLSDLKYFLRAKKDQLTSLSIRWSMKGKRSVTPCLKVCGSKLEKLTLVDYDLLEEETESSFEDLQHMTALKEFHAFATLGPASSVTNLFLSGKWSTLQVLRLDSSVSIDDGVVIAICKKCPLLEDLDLENTPYLSDKGLRYIHRCPLLHTLNLSACDNLRGRTVKYIAKCPRIRVLRLDNMDLKNLVPGLNHILNLSNLCELTFLNCLNFQVLPLSSFPSSLMLLKKFLLGPWESQNRCILNKLESLMPNCKFEWYLYDEDEEIARGQGVGGLQGIVKGIDSAQFLIDGAQVQVDGAQFQVDAAQVQVDGAQVLVDGAESQAGFSGTQHQDKSVDVRCLGDVHSSNCDPNIDECSNWNLFIFGDDGNV